MKDAPGVSLYERKQQYRQERERAHSLVFGEGKIVTVPARSWLLLKTPEHIRIEYDSPDKTTQAIAALGRFFRISPDIGNKSPHSRGNAVIIDDENKIRNFNRHHENYRRDANPEWLKYENLQTLGDDEYIAPAGTYRNVSIRNGFIHISDIRHEDVNFNHAAHYKPKGKFHISVAPDDVGKAWDALAPIVLQSDLEIDIKVVESTERSAAARGKTIVLYFAPHNMQETEKWTSLLQEVKAAFAQHGIAPGPEVHGDHALKGNDGFVFMREGDSDYEQGVVTNPYTPRPDFPLAHIDISTPTRHRDDARREPGITGEAGRSAS